jgi:hypothetical protein
MPTEIPRHLAGHVTTGPIAGLHPAPIAKTIGAGMKIAPARVLAGRRRNAAGRGPPRCAGHVATAKTVAPLHLRRQVDMGRIESAEMETMRIVSEDIALRPPIGVLHHTDIRTITDIGRCTTTVRRRPTPPRVEMTAIDTAGIAMRRTEITQIMVPRPLDTSIEARLRGTIVVGGMRGDTLTLGLRMVGASDRRIAGHRETTERKTVGHRVDGSGAPLPRPHVPMIGTLTIAMVRRPLRAASATKTNERDIFKRGGYARPR